MTVEIFFANFRHLADAPNGVQKLRELILQLAVQGKLVPQNPNDEPASVLLERIEDERSKLIVAKQIRNKKITSLGDAPYELPDSWSWVPIGQICRDWGQKIPDRRFSYIDVSAIDNERGVVAEPVVTDAADAPSRARKLVRPGTVIYSTVRPYLLNIAVIDQVYAPEPIASTAFAIIHPLGNISSQYVFWFLRSPIFIDYVESKMLGVAYPAINDSLFFSGLFPLPPLEEQKRIVSKVDQLMALCDELETRQQKNLQGRVRLNNAALDALLNASEPDEFTDHWQRIWNNFDLLYDHPDTIAKLRAAILQLAVQGKLVPQDPNDEPASFLLERIKTEKERLVKKKVIRKSKPFQRITESEFEAEMPMGWELCRLADIALTLITGPFGSSLHKSDYVQGGIPVINPASLKEERITPLPNMAVNEKTLARLSNFVLKEHDIVMARRGEMGRCALVTQKEAGWLCGTGSVVLRLSNEVYYQYFVKLISSDAVREYLSGSSVGATMSNLNQKILMNMIVQLPPKAEQKRIVAKVDQLMALCDELESKLTQAQEHSEKLTEATVWQLLVA